MCVCNASFLKIGLFWFIFEHYMSLLLKALDHGSRRVFLVLVMITLVLRKSKYSKASQKVLIFWQILSMLGLLKLSTDLLVWLNSNQQGRGLDILLYFVWRCR